MILSTIARENRSRCADRTLYEVISLKSVKHILKENTDVSVHTHLHRQRKTQILSVDSLKLFLEMVTADTEARATKPDPAEGIDSTCHHHTLHRRTLASLLLDHRCC